MEQKLSTQAAWHPLLDGGAPAWACAWGEDGYGVYADFSVAGVIQRMRWIPAGVFRMGSPVDEPGRWSDEGPQHIVQISHGFWLADTPCTQALWQAVMDESPSYFPSPRRPVESVSWDNVQAFLEKINQSPQGLDLQLPSEAQWEYACRAGSGEALYTGPIDILGGKNAPALDAIAWYGGNSGQDYDLEKGVDSSGWAEMQYPNPKSGTRRVGLKQPNAWGLYDMLGNVDEWCADGWRDYDEVWQLDPVGSGAGRVIRGGAWGSGAGYCRSACRNGDSPVLRLDYLGFRLARVQAKGEFR